MALDGSTSITWLGHGGVEILTPGGKTVLVDPWFGNPNSPRTQEQQAACDVLLITHGHFDHFDADSLALASRLTPTMPCIHELGLYLADQLGDDAKVIGMNQGGTVETDGLKVTLVPAVHSNGDTMGDPAVHYFGAPGGFVIELENGRRLYHSGDTTVFGDMALIRELYQPDLAMLSIGGHFTMGPDAASVAVGLLGVKDVLPIHWGTFPLLAGTPAALADACRARGLSVTVHDWRAGDTLG